MKAFRLYIWLTVAIIVIVFLAFFLFPRDTKMSSARLEFIFPNLHFDSDWDTSNGRSLWTLFIANNIVESPLRIDMQSKYVSGIAESWAYSADKKTLHLKISPDRKFHDNSNITPTDVGESIKRLIITQKAAHSDLFDSICSNTECNGISVQGDQVTIKLDKPINGLVYSLSSPEFGVLPPAYYNNQITNIERLKNLSGPYQVQSFTKDRMDLLSVKGHPLISSNGVHKISIVEIKDFSDSLKYYNANNNVVLVGSDYSSSSVLARMSGKKYISAPSLTEFILTNVDSPKLNTISERKDILSLFHKLKSKFEFNKEIADSTDQIFTASSIARVEQESVLSLYDGNIHSKKQTYTMLLFDWMKDSPLPFQLRDMLVAYNIDLKVQVVTIPQGLELIKKREYDFVYVYSGVSALDPIAELVYLFKHPITQFNYKNAEGNSLLERAKSEPDHQQYLATIKKIHMHLLSEYRILPLLHTRMIYLAKGEYKLKEMNHFDGGFNIWDWIQEDR